ncbi:MAG: gamma-glutamyl-gamma-aminobutyrate hydrolase [Candidatus Binatia bacterium]|nr:MAG: gamma-glutamyl-gamma-aminobutyrate hydrolase [Candidatus Binatia bacterium]
MKNRPIIGITSYARDQSELPSFSLPAGYADQIADAGGIPVVLPPVIPDPATVLDRLDGLLLSGGGDVSPESYGGEHHETVYSVSEERDQFEFALLRAALERKELPILCICRGLQVLNVVQGGTLHEHLPDFLGDAVPHRLPPRQTSRHLVRLEPRSRLGQIFSTDKLEVLSWHHQGIDRLGTGLRAVGWSDDGLIEAVEQQDHPWCLAVQWHPEMDPTDHLQRRLFQAFVMAAAQNGRSKDGRKACR